MNKDRIFARTELGNELRDDPKGRISGDEMLLIALLDGKTSVDGITKKVPPSVRPHLDATFARLLSAQIIAEIGGGEAPQAVQQPEEQPEKQPVSERCAVLEQELVQVRAHLEATRARQKEIEVGFHKLRLRVSAYTEVRQAKLTMLLRELPHRYAGNELWPVFEQEINEAIESLHPLNHAIAEQQQIFDQTLRLKNGKVKAGYDMSQKEHLAEEEREANAHPQYRKLRGLEFFKGFANAELLQFLEIAKWQEAQAGEAVLNEGDVGMPFFIIVSGSVAVSKGKKQVATLDQGDFFGEFAYLSGEEPYRTARVVAESHCELLMVDPLDIEFAPVQLRLHVVEALLRGQVRRTLISSKPMGSLQGEATGGNDAVKL